MNLLSNAIDAIEDNCQNQLDIMGKLTIRTTWVDADLIEIAIADNGCGMTDEVQRKMFDPFFTTKPLGKGTGLGMPISYKIIVDKHNGRLTCRSIPGEETEFIVQIPCRVNSQPLWHPNPVGSVV